MSILDPKLVEKANDCAEIFQKVYKPSPLLESATEEEYEKVRAVYWPIYNAYKKTFYKCCLGNDLIEINKKLADELNSVGFTRFTPFADIKDIQLLKEYVFSLVYPASYSDMLTFLKRVLMGDLEFLCQIHTDSGETCINILMSSGLANTILKHNP